MAEAPHTAMRELADIEHWFSEAIRHSAVTLTTVAAAVVDCDKGLLEAIGRSARELRAGSRQADAALIRMMADSGAAREDPRMPLALMQVAQHQGLIANQFELIAEQLEQIDPNIVDARGSAARLAEMARLSGVQLTAAQAAFDTRDVAAAERIERDDDAVDRLNREVFQATLDLEGSIAQRELAYRHVLIARSLERIADNAVDIAEQTAF